MGAAYDREYYVTRQAYLCNPYRHQTNVRVLLTAYRQSYGRLPESVLELGCGYGISVSMMRLMGIEAAGTENSPYLLSGPLSGNPYIIRPIGLRVPVASKSYDVVYSSDFLEHFDPVDVLVVASEHLRIARHMVYVIICFPEHHSPDDDAYHLCLRPKSWWKALFTSLGGTVLGESEWGLLIKPGEITPPSPAKTHPAISVVIPCFNLASYLPQTVDSVVAQTYEDWEIIIVNDGSTDNTSEVVQELRHKYGQDRIIPIDQSNKGPSVARNVGIRAAHGKYILPLDADDILATSFLQETSEILDTFPEVDLVYTHLQEFDGRNGVWECPPWDKRKILYTNLLPYASLYRKEVWAKAGGYDEDMREGYEDWEFWVSAAEQGCMAVCVPKRLFFYRKHPGSRSTTAVHHHNELVQRILAKHQRLALAQV